MFEGIFSRLVIIFLLYAVFGILEQLIPAEKSHGLKGRGRNVIFTSIYLFLGGSIAIILLKLSSFESSYTIPATGPIVMIIFMLVYLFCGDLLFYWYHRLEHNSKILWPIHELHHSDTELNVTTSLRTHWIEKPVQLLFLATPVILFLGSNNTLALVLPIFQTTWLFFAHANLRLDLRFLTPVFTGPQFHRIHHSSQLKHQNKNYSQYFPVIDLMFGTYYAPKRGEFPKTGTDSMPSDVPVFAALIKPIRLWLRRLIPSIKRSPLKR